MVRGKFFKVREFYFTFREDGRPFILVAFNFESVGYSGTREFC